MKYPLSIYKPFNADIFRTRWEDVLVVPLKIEGVEGLEESVKVEWFRMKDTISYEKLDRNSDKGYIQIKKNGDYFVIINDIYRFCPISFVLPAHVPQLFPNPSHPNASITLATGLKEEELGNTKILLINERGNVISKFDLKDASPQLIAPAVSGIYTVIIESPDSDVKQMKMVVVN